MPFSAEITGVDIQADIEIDGQTLVFKYDIIDPDGKILIPKPEIEILARQDGLWNHTCFEAFLAIPNSPSYYEFNFSPKSAWNVYKFTNYREPQPPKRSEDFSIKKMDVSGTKFIVQCENHTAFSQFEVSLNAVIEFHDHQKHYFALAHNGGKPDFHLRKNFIIKKG